jgi:hypothetical protein
MSRVLGIFLAAALVVAATASNTSALSHVPQASTTSSGANNHLAGCHDDAPPASHPNPLPAPVKYQCCITGHEAAVLHASDLPWPVTECAHFVEQSDPCALPSFSKHFETVLLLSADPPLQSPLRI